MSRRAIRALEHELHAKAARRAPLEAGDATGAPDERDSDDAQSSSEPDSEAAHASARPTNVFALLGEESDDDAAELNEESSELAESAQTHRGVCGESQSLRAEARPHAMTSRASLQADGSAGGTGGGKAAQPTERGKSRKKTKNRKKKSQSAAGQNDRAQRELGDLEEAVDFLAEHIEANDGITAFPLSQAEREDPAFVKDVLETFAYAQALALSQVSEVKGAGGAATTERPRASKQSKGLHVTADKVLLIDPNKLNTEYELRRLFGAEVIQSVRGPGASAGARGARGRRKPALRRCAIVSAREEWGDISRFISGLSTTIDTEAALRSGQLSYFRYEHSGAYRQVQAAYRTVVESHDPNQLVALLSRSPFHVDSLLQLAEVYRHMGELDRASELIERALYALESSWSHSFRPFSGACRMRFEVPENRSLFIALFRYQQLIERRGLHKTALEICKLLLLLEPERDAMGCLLSIDSLAHLAGDYALIPTLMQGFHEIELDKLPNFALSSALASWKALPRTANSAAGLAEAADSQLVRALMSFPQMLDPMLRACDEEPTAAVLRAEMPLFWRDPYDEPDPILDRIARVYAIVSRAAWTNASTSASSGAGSRDAIAWLKRCAKRAAELSKSRAQEFLAAQAHGNVSREYIRNRGLFRDVYLSDFGDAAANHLPANLLVDGGADGPVGDAGLHFQRRGAPRADAALRAENGSVSVDAISARDAVTAFLRSILPWNNAEQIAELAESAAENGDSRAEAVTRGADPHFGLNQGGWEALQRALQAVEQQVGLAAVLDPEHGENDGDREPQEDERDEGAGGT